MKLFRNMILSLATLSLMTVSCAPEETYVPGAKDLEGCYGVYFPPQELAGAAVDLDPTAPTKVEITIARQVANDAVTVPVEVTGDDVFEVSEISFENGETETTFEVNFPTAEIGTKYALSIKVTDPQYASTYSLDAQSISLSVTRVKWNLLTGPAGEKTGLLRDDCFSVMYGINNYEGPVTIYERDDIPGLYRCTPLYSALFMANAFGYGPSMESAIQEAWVVGDGSVIIDATDPNKVWIPRQPLGLMLSSGDGAITLLSCCKEAGFEGNLYGTLKDGVITFPKGGIAMTFANASKDYQVNDNGLFRICLPGVSPVELDYSMTLAIGESNDNGQIPFRITMGTDIAKTKVAVFEGTLNGSQVNQKVSEIVAGTVTSSELTNSGTYTLSDLGETGIYTIVAVGSNADGAAVVSKSASFGYIAAGDKVPVNAVVGLIVSDKYAPEGHTAMNSLEYYAYGQDITKAYMSLYKKQDWDQQQTAVLNDLISKRELTKSQLADLNANGVSDLYINLQSGIEYVLVLYATNGYKSEVFVAEAATRGLPDPLQMDYVIEDLIPAETKADYCKEWVFWAGTPNTDGRSEVGPLTITDAGLQKYQYENEGGEIVEAEYEGLNIKGFWRPVVDAGYLEDDTMVWEYYSGVIVPIHDYVGSFESSDGTFDLMMLSFYTSASGGFIDGALCGAFTEDGNIAFVDMMDDGKDYWLTSLGVFQGSSYAGDLIQYDEMMFVDPANLPDESRTASKASIGMLSEVKTHFDSDFNCVETLRSQLYDAIDKMNERPAVRPRGKQAGYQLEIQSKQVDCTILQYNGDIKIKGKKEFVLNF